MPRKTFLLTTIIVMFLAGLGTGFILGKINGAQNATADFPSFFDIEKIFSKKPTFDLLGEGADVINTRYAGAKNVKLEDLIYGAMEGMVKVLDDPYSVFLRPKAAKLFEEDVGGVFEGIGAEIGIREEGLTVISPLKGNPAEHAGLKAGDKILFIDDIETKDLSLDEAVQRIRGPKGSKVTLIVSRKDHEGNINIPIIRDTIRIPILEWEKAGEDIAHISLFHFTETAKNDFTDIAHEILQSDAKRIVLDLRNNPGGFLDAAVDIAGWFMEKDSLVVVEDWGDKKAQKDHRTNGSGALKDYPIVVLTNKGSASASEILAGALRDNRAVQLIGEATFGKGSVQELSDLSDGSSIKITVAQWLTPRGVSIQGNGLVPDIVVEMTEKIFETEGDVQLEKAIEVVKSL